MVRGKERLAAQKLICTIITRGTCKELRSRTLILAFLCVIPELLQRMVSHLYHLWTDLTMCSTYSNW